METLNMSDESFYIPGFNLSFGQKMSWSEEQILQILIKKPEYDPKIIKPLVLYMISLLGFALKAQAKYRQVKASEFFERPTKGAENISSTPNDDFSKIFNYSQNNPAKLAEEEKSLKLAKFSEENSAFYSIVKSA